MNAKQKKTKNLIAALLIVALVAICLVSCIGPLMPEKAPSYVDGVYTGVGKGMMGDIKVEVTVEGGAITNVVLKAHDETEGIYEKAETGVVARIIENQTYEVDGIAGATFTSNGIKAAVKNALESGAIA